MSRRSEAFAAALDADALDADALDGGGSDGGRPADAGQQRLLALAGGLRGLGAAAPAAPDPQFRAALRQRLVAVATVQPPEPDPRPARRSGAGGWRVRRRVAALAGGAAMATAVAGVG